MIPQEDAEILKVEPLQFEVADITRPMAEQAYPESRVMGAGEIVDQRTWGGGGNKAKEKRPRKQP
jgi:hypothetical protein